MCTDSMLCLLEPAARGDNSLDSFGSYIASIANCGGMILMPLYSFHKSCFSSRNEAAQLKQQSHTTSQP